MKKIDELEVKSVIEELGLEGEFTLDEVNNVYDMITIGDDILRNENENVEDINSEKNLIINMVNTLYDENGCGIAAPQVGINKNIFIVKVVGKDENGEEIVEFPLTVFINPRILEYSDEKEWGYEGCLSVPGFFAMVERSKKIKIEYTDIFGEKHIGEFEDFTARAIQHEYDHLLGIVYTDIADMQTFTTQDNLYSSKTNEENN